MKAHHYISPPQTFFRIMSVGCHRTNFSFLMLYFLALLYCYYRSVGFIVSLYSMAYKNTHLVTTSQEMNLLEFPYGIIHLHLLALK